LSVVFALGIFALGFVVGLAVAGLALLIMASWSGL
jgi:hypothetical protein